MLMASKNVQDQARCRTKHESAEKYIGVVYRQKDWRVIECRDGIQWIIQKRVNCGRRGVEWKSKSYSTTQDALNRDWRTHSKALSDMFNHLPRRIGGRANG